jgi:hypothetical protein
MFTSLWEGSTVLAFASSIGTITQLFVQASSYELIGSNILSNCSNKFTVWSPIPRNGRLITRVYRLSLRIHLRNTYVPGTALHVLLGVLVFKDFS